MMRLEGEVAIVTGAAQGIGEATARLLHHHGATVVIADINDRSAREVARDIGKGADEAWAYPCDVSQKASIHELVEATMDRYRRLDILVNNAAIKANAPVEDMTEHDFDRVIAVNLKGSFLGIQAVVPIMKVNRAGKIINLASTTGKIGMPNMINYAASKAGIVGMTKTAAKELAPYGIRVNAVQPGFIDTQMSRNNSEELQDQKIAEIPLGRIGNPDDVARVIVFLASNYAAYMTGQVIEVTGGRYM